MIEIILSTVSLILSSIVLIFTIFFAIKYNQKFKELLTRINNSQKYEYKFDKKQQEYIKNLSTNIEILASEIEILKKK